MRQFWIISLVGTLLSTSALQAEEFDLAKMNKNSDVHFMDDPQASKRAQLYRVDTKNQSFYAVGPFKAVQGQVEISDDNPPHLPGGKLIGKDTGRTLGLNIKGVYSNGENQEMVLSFSSNLFTKRTKDAAVTNAQGKKEVGVYSTEQERVSVKKLLFADGYYLVAGVGAEVLTDKGPIARDIQEAFHNSSWGNTKKVFSYQKGYGPEGVSADASIGVGKELSTKAGGVEVFFVPQVVAQASTAERNNQLQFSTRAGVKAGGTEITGYGEYDASLGKDGNVIGVVAEQKVFGNEQNRTSVFVAVERRVDAMDKYYGAENKLNKNLYFRAGITKKFGPGGSRASSAGAQ